MEDVRSVFSLKPLENHWKTIGKPRARIDLKGRFSMMITRGYMVQAESDSASGVEEMGQYGYWLTKIMGKHMV